MVLVDSVLVVEDDVGGGLVDEEHLGVEDQDWGFGLGDDQHLECQQGTDLFLYIRFDGGRGDLNTPQPQRLFVVQSDRGKMVNLEIILDRQVVVRGIQEDKRGLEPPLQAIPFLCAKVNIQLLRFLARTDKL